MDALMAALVAGLVAIMPDRAALIASAPHRRAGRTIAQTLMTAAAMATVSTALGIMIAPRLAPAARLLMLALALVLLGLEFLLRRLPMAPRGALVAALAGSGLWFVVLTIAMRAALPWLAVPGAVVGVVAPIAVAGSLGDGWGRLPLIPARRLAGAGLVSIGAILACVAIGIV